MSTPDAQVTGRESSARSLVHRWPSVLAVAFVLADLLSGGTGRDELATIIVAAAVCYLAAAASSRPWVGWAAIPVCGLLITLGESAGMDRLAVLSGFAALLLAWGLWRHAARPDLVAQALGVLGYGTVAVVALVVAPTAGLGLAAVGLIAHGVWDIVHLRRRAVVSPSVAEFCVVLDIPLGLAAVVALLT